MVICVTLYNEPAVMLQSTLAAIAQNACNAADRHGEMTVCIIADGADRLHPSVIDLMARLGAPAPTDRAMTQDGLDVTDMRLDAAALLDRDGGARDKSATIRVLFCVKTQNYGKLDSHWWFYRRLCARIAPSICYQIDAGTRPDADALLTMYDVFAERPNVGAVASSVRILPQHERSMLERLQAYEFGLEKTIHLTAQASSGFLTVLPGQCSALRWSAISTAPQDGAPSPLDSYLRGRDCAQAYEKLMFLAEDRVIGFEIFAKKDADFVLDYTTAAVSETDACHTVNELFRQRRRWINSGFACRMWALVNYPRYLRDSAASAKAKTASGVSVLVMLFYTVLDICLPFMAFMVLASIYAGVLDAAAAVGLVGAAPHVAAAALLLIILGPIFLALSAHLRSCSIRAVNRIMLASAAAIGAYLACSIFLNPAALAPIAWVVVLCAALPIVAAYAHDRRLGLTMLKNSPVFVLMNLQYFLMLEIYAVRNIDDDSWGTKGLETRTEGRIGRDLKRLKWGFMALWLSVNAALIALVVISGAWAAAHLAIMAALTAFFVLGGVSSLAMTAGKRLQRLPA